VNPQVEVRYEEEGEVATMKDVVTGPRGPLPEVEVDQINEPSRTQPQGVPMVVIRVNEDVEDMSYVAGNKVEHYTFEAGVRYRVPIWIAYELENIGKIWH
jgi:hypothetical protein